MQTVTFFIGLEGNKSASTGSIVEKCNTDLHSCGSVLQWASDGSDFVVDNSWMSTDLFAVENHGYCTVINPSRKQIGIVGCNNQNMALCQISCDSGIIWDYLVKQNIESTYFWNRLWNNWSWRDRKRKTWSCINWTSLFGSSGEVSFWLKFKELNTIGYDSVIRNASD